MSHHHEYVSAHDSRFEQDVIAEIKRQLAQIQYGSLEISVHNGQVVQLERREKKRWGKGKLKITRALNKKLNTKKH